MRTGHDLDGPTEQKVLAALFDQLAGDGIGIAIFGRSQPYARGLDLVADFARKSLPHQFLGEIRRGSDQYQSRERSAGRLSVGVPAPGQFAREQERHPAAHGRADHHLRTGRKALEDRNALFQPAPDGARREITAGFAVPGIVEAEARPAVFESPRIQSQRLGALHVRLEATKPEKPRRGTLAGPHRDPAHLACAADLDKGRAYAAGLRAGHGIVKPCQNRRISTSLREPHRSVNGPLSAGAWLRWLLGRTIFVR